MIAMYSFWMFLSALVVLWKLFTWWHGVFWHEAAWKASSPQQKVNHGSFGSLRPRKESWICWKNQLLDWIPRFDVSIYLHYLLSIYYRNHIKSHQITSNHIKSPDLMVPDPRAASKSLPNSLIASRASYSICTVIKFETAKPFPWKGLKRQ